MQNLEQQVGADALVEWLEHPVTEWLAATMGERKAVAQSNRGEVFYPGYPEKTQENISYLNGAMDELADWAEALKAPHDPDDIHPLNNMVVPENPDE